VGSRPAPVTPLFDEARFEEGSGGEDHGGGVAARVRDEARAADVGALDLREPVDGLGEELGVRVWVAVPLRVGGGVLEAEVCRQVDHEEVPVAGEEFRGDVRRDAVGGCKEDAVGLAGQRLGLGGAEREPVDVLGKVGEHVGKAPARKVPRGGSHEADLGVVREETDELRACVAGRADHAALFHRQSVRAFILRASAADWRPALKRAVWIESFSGQKCPEWDNGVRRGSGPPFPVEGGARSATPRRSREPLR